MYFIYKIENLVNHKKYIGLTNNIARRRARHFTDLRYNRHDNHFLQKEFNIYGENNFSFTIEFQGDVSVEEIGLKEKEFIAKYDSYKNGYNQNEGGNFGPSNGGSKLTQSDIFNILAAIEFMQKPGQILADIFEVSRTTISRIGKGINHCQYKEEYDKLPLEERQAIYQIFNKSFNLYEKKVNSATIEVRRHLTEEQVHLVLLNEELHRPLPITEFMKRFNIKSFNTFTCILKGQSYKNFSLSYSKLTKEQKDKLATLL